MQYYIQPHKLDKSLFSSAILTCLSRAKCLNRMLWRRFYGLNRGNSCFEAKYSALSHKLFGVIKVSMSVFRELIQQQCIGCIAFMQCLSLYLY